MISPLNRAALFAFPLGRGERVDKHTPSPCGELSRKRFEDLALGVKSRTSLLSMKFFETKVDRLLRKSMTGEPTHSGERVPPDVLVQAEEEQFLPKD
jgi:hypothetical protein